MLMQRLTTFTRNCAKVKIVIIIFSICYIRLITVLFVLPGKPDPSLFTHVKRDGSGLPDGLFSYITCTHSREVIWFIKACNTNLDICVCVYMQVNKDSLREVFRKYGAIQEWIVCPALECVLFCYQSTEDSIRIKEYIESNSDLLGINVVVQFASKSNVDMIIEQSQAVSPRSWFSESSSGSSGLPPQDYSSSASPSTPFSRVIPASDWDSSDSNAPSSFGQQSSNATTPGSSLWSDSGFLSGLSSPWHGSLTVPGVPGTSSVTSPQTNSGSEGVEPAPNCSNPSISPFLPNGLL